MKNNRKILLGLGLILLIMVLGVASIFVAGQLASQKAVAPTAPSSKPKAAEVFTRTTTGLECEACTYLKGCSTGFNCDAVDGKCKKADGTSVCWSGSTACVVAGTVLAAACVPTSVITCTPDCPTACGTAASTITTCKNSCNTSVTKACPAVAACATTTELTIVKKAYLNETTNTADSYGYITEINTVAKDETFVYDLIIENVSEATASSVVISDTLNGQKQNLLTFVDANPGCTYTAADRKISCNNKTVQPGEKVAFAFRVKVSADAVNGDVIKNIGKVTYGSVTKQAGKDLTVSTVLGCNNTCTIDDECSGGLTCDTTTNKCRATACLTKTNCNCTVVTAAPTAAPTLAKCNKACDTDTDCVAGLICDTATSMCRKEACTTKTNCLCTVVAATAAPSSEISVEPTVLPETGILDIPGVAAFGGGLLMAVVGILLAL
jgi:hypothetical protein